MKGNLDLDSIEKFKDFVIWRNAHPKEYGEFLKGFKETMIDFAKIMNEIMQEVG